MTALPHGPQVYAGLNQLTGELMAVKVLELVTRHGYGADMRQQLGELKSELELYKKLNHKHVVGGLRGADWTWGSAYGRRTSGGRGGVYA